MEKYNILEITKIAMDMEKEGQEFYREAAALTTEENLRSIFLLLAEQEKKHLELFHELHKALSENNDISKEYLYDEEVSLYMKALVENKVFKESDLTRLRNMNSMKDALNLGIDSEKNSILFYNEILKNSKSVEALRVLSLIIGEEKQHLVNLTNLINTI